MNIKKKRERIEAKIGLWRDTLVQLQETCPHSPESITKTSGGNTGNYDPSNNTSWLDLTCEDCGKRWTVFQ